MSTSELSEERTGRPEDITAVPVRHPGRWVAALIVAITVASLIRSAIVNKAFKWHIVGHYMFDSRVLHGVLVTVELTVIAMVLGILLGVVLAVMRQSPNKLVSGAAWVYVYVLRGTPVLVQLLFWGYISAVYKTISLGVPFGGPAIVSFQANSVITLFVAAVLGFGLNEAAYMSEIVRAGFLSVGEGQTEAAQSIGMTRLQTMRHIILPQAMRVIIPPTGNETISMLKTTSIVVILGGVYDLMFEASQIYSANFATIQLLIVASVWYLALTSVLYVGQYYIERYFGRGFSRSEQRRNKLFSLRSRREEPGVT